MSKQDEEVLVSSKKIPDDNSKKQNKMNIFIILIILVAIGIIAGVSYAYWLVRVSQETSNILNSGCLSITLDSEKNAIELENAEPISDSAAEDLTPFEFTITNTCTASVDYTVSLEIMDVTDRLDSSYIAVNFNNEGKKLLSKYRSVTPTYSDGKLKAVEARKLKIGTLAGGEEVTYTLKLWMDESVTSTDSMNKYFTSKISVSATQDLEKLALAEYITTLSESDTTNIATDDTEDANIRYIGADPDNYLCFDEDCTNGKWRVIGIMNNMTTSDGNQAKLVKIIKDEEIGKYVWDSAGTSDWSTSSLKTYLNGEWYTENLNGYDNLIENVVWNLGGYSTSAITASEFYTYERGTIVYGDSLTTWTGKAALIYPSDYGYATSGGTTTRETCLTYNLSSWNSYSDCYGNDYLLDTTAIQWTLMPGPFLSNFSSALAYSIYQQGLVVAGPPVIQNMAVRPSLYLKEDIQILDGDGTSNDPWVVGYES